LGLIRLFEGTKGSGKKPKMSGPGSISNPRTAEETSAGKEKGTRNGEPGIPFRNKALNCNAEGISSGLRGNLRVMRRGGDEEKAKKKVEEREGNR